MAKTKISEAQNKLIMERARRVLFSSVFGTVLPVIIGMTILILFSELGKFTSFIHDGTFCLFSAGLITSAMYIMDDNTELIREKWDKRIHKYSKPIWIIVATVFGLLFAKENLGFDHEINKWFLWFISIIPFLFAIWALYRALVIEGKGNPPTIDPQKKSQEGVDNILDNLV